MQTIKQAITARLTKQAEDEGYDLNSPVISLVELAQILEDVYYDLQRGLLDTLDEEFLGAKYDTNTSAEILGEAKDVADYRQKIYARLKSRKVSR